MPIERVVNYYFCGPVKVTLFTEEEMASALSISVERLREAMEGDGDRVWGLSYHMHPLSNKEGKFYFQASSFLRNISVWNCPGHEMEVESRGLNQTKLRCKHCVYIEYK